MRVVRQRTCPWCSMGTHLNNEPLAIDEEGAEARGHRHAALACVRLYRIGRVERNLFKQRTTRALAPRVNDRALEQHALRSTRCVKKRRDTREIKV